MHTLYFWRHPLSDWVGRHNAGVTYKRDQWIDSFEGQLSILRAHLTARVLGTMSLAAWHEFGRAKVDLIMAAKELSLLLDKRTVAPG